jgi:hypothetical protein
MPAFKKGDNVFILPRFAHLYPGGSVVVADVQPDPFRSTFNDYTLLFEDSSTERVFEFQIIDNPANCKTLAGVLTFDSQTHMPAGQLRGPETDRRVILEAAEFDIDMKIQPAKGNTSIIGQVLERSSSAFKIAHVSILSPGGMPTHKVASDRLGVFRFSNVPGGRTTIAVVIPQNNLRVLCEVFL